ncbi:MAG TPA: hypothetical protein VMF69_13315 [Gemmataceae bacterium]|nr:hypothetical protein [Gemmataceae bacterium]
MECRCNTLGWLLTMAFAAATNAALAQTLPESAVYSSQSTVKTEPSLPQTADYGPRAVQQGFVPAPVPLDELPPPLRDRVRVVLEHPTLASRGPLEAFRCRPSIYFWLLDHPDVAMRLWRGLGAKCSEIHALGEGTFAWRDTQYGEVHWQTIVRNGRQRVWYAEGRVKAGPLLPTVSLHAVVVLTHQEGSDGKGRPAVRHQMDMILHTDSRAVSLAARLFGASAPHMAEEYVGQMQMFFGALAWYLSEHPNKAAVLFEELKLSPGFSLGG